MRKKIIIILLSFFLISGIAFGGYSYFFSDNNMLSFLKKDESKSLNYSFNTKANFNLISNGKKEGFDLVVKNGSVVTKDNALKQRISVESIDLDISSKDKFSVKNVDIVSDNEKVYLKGDFGELGKNLPEKIIKVLSKGEYVKIDNSKVILDSLGYFKNNELIKELVTGFTTSNPQAYFKNNATEEKLIKYLKSDDLINFVFKDDQYDETTKKTSLVFNERVCELSPVVNKFLSEIYGFSPISENKEECENQLKEANQFLAMVNIYKEGDSKAGNYKFIINQGKIADISINYSKHTLDTWSISLSEPNGKVVFKANGNSEKLLSSLFKLNIDESGIKIKGEIKDGEGRIDLSSKENPYIISNGFISFKDYLINEYDLKGEMTFLETSFSAKGDKNKGNIKIIGKGENIDINYETKKGNLVLDLRAKNDKGEENVRIDLKAEYPTFLKVLTDLDKFKYDLNIFVKGELELKSKFDSKNRYLLVDYKLYGYGGKVSDLILFEGDCKNKKIDLEINEYNNNGEKDDYINFSLNNQKVTGSIYENNKKYADLTGDFKNLGDFDIKIDYPTEQGVIKFKGITEKNTYKYNLVANLDGIENFVVGDMEIKFEDNKITSNGKIKSEKENSEANYSFEHSYKFGDVKYELPKDYKEVDVKISENIILPNLEQFGNYKNIGGPEIAIVAVTGGAIAGTVGYISLQGYSNEAKNTKVLSDLNSLVMAIETRSTNKGGKIEDFVLKGNKINFEELGIKRSDFKQSDGSDYLLFVNRKNNDFYQVFGYTIDQNGNKIAIIKGNYYQRKKYNPKSLVRINGKIIENGDIIE